MTPAADSNSLLPLFFLLLMPLGLAGLALIHQGLGRSRSAAHTMLATMCAISVAAIVFVAVGFSLAGLPDGPQHTVMIGRLHVGLAGALPLFAQSIDLSGAAGTRPLLLLCLQMFSVAMCAIIPLSAGSDRWRLTPICASTVVLAGLVWPLFAHWTWGGGMLTNSAALGLPPWTDLGGAGVIQVVGGLSALSVAWIVGPRRGKYSSDGVATAIPGHNIVQVMAGCFLALVGWIGLDAAVSTLIYSLAPNRLPLVAINAMLSASAGCLAALVTTRVRYRKPDASITANGWVAGLVAGSAAGAMSGPMAAIVIGLVAGLIVAFLVESLELRLLIDDPGGAISIHAGAGIWGLLAAGLFGGGGAPAVLAQLFGIATLLGLIFPLLHGMNLLLDRFTRFRVDMDGDWQGMDIRELGAGAYPEFVVHADEFMPR